jgi:transposase
MKGYDRKIYKHRNQIERFLGRIKRCRRVATRYEEMPPTSPALSDCQHSLQISSECPYYLERVTEGRIAN